MQNDVQNSKPLKLYSGKTLFEFGGNHCIFGQAPREITTFALSMTRLCFCCSQAVLGSIGQDFTDEQMERMRKQCDTDKDGKVRLIENFSF